MANIPTTEQRLHTISMSYFKQMKSNEHKLNHLFPQHYQNQYSTRSQAKGIVAVPPARTKTYNPNVYNITILSNTYLLFIFSLFYSISICNIIVFVNFISCILIILSNVF